MLMAILLVTTSVTTYADHLSQKLMVSARLSGAQEVPAVTTNANGVASFFMNASMDTMCVNISVNGLSGPITGIHVHDGEAGTNGPVLTNLTPYVSGNRITTMLTGSDLTPAIRAQYLRGELYLNVHTAANPNGEIRGQLTLESDYAFHAYIDAAQEVPLTTSPGTGVGVFNLSIDKRELTVNVTVDNLSGPIIGAHLHYGKPGVAGGVAINLTTLINGNSIKGTVPTALPADLLESVMNDSIYVNIHTNSNMLGEIRGNVKLAEGLAFDAYLDTMQETTPVVLANGYGSSYMKLNATLDTLWYNVQVSQLSGPITAAHIHAGEPDQSGPVLLNMTGDITTNNRIIGMKTGTDLTPTIIGNLLELGTYLNVHTAANPNGEVRGQIYRVAREGYDISLDGVQQVPANAETGLGSGLVSINRDRTNSHVMIVLSGLTGPLTAAHFHANVFGDNGPVVYNLTPWFDGTSTEDQAFGYWHDDDANTPFTPANELQFRRDSIYVNVHTADNPNGEIRGQVLRDGPCTVLAPTAVNDITKTSLNAKLYPNPITNDLNIEISDADYTKGASVKLLDMTGKILMTKANINQLTTIDLTTYSRGVFFIVVETESKRMTEKIVLSN